jgi:hypothetical protein
MPTHCKQIRTVEKTLGLHYSVFQPPPPATTPFSKASPHENRRFLCRVEKDGLKLTKNCAMHEARIRTLPPFSAPSIFNSHSL